MCQVSAKREMTGRSIPGAQAATILLLFHDDLLGGTLLVLHLHNISLMTGRIEFVKEMSVYLLRRVIAILLRRVALGRIALGWVALRRSITASAC